MEAAAEAPPLPPPYTSNMFSFEASFDKETGRRFVDDMKHVSAICSVVYVILLFCGRRYMSSRAPFVLRRLLVVWNLSLAGFSLFGAVRTVPELWHSLYYHGWAHSLCDASIYGGGPGFWVFLFTLSKVRVSEYCIFSFR